MKYLLSAFLIIFASCATTKPNYEVDGASPTRLQGYLSEILNTDQSRSFGNTKELDRVAKLITDSISKHGIPCTEQIFSVESNSYKNIICKIDQGKENTVIIGAHYDVCGNQPGADDNGSGVSGLIETARILSKYRDKLNVNIEFVAYTLEEPPNFRTKNMGSYVHAYKIKEMGINNIEVYVLEMIGYFTDEEKQDYPIGIMGLFYPDKGNYIAAVSNLGSSGLTSNYCDAIDLYGKIDCQRLVAPSWVAGVDFSDHRNYWKFEYEAMMITNTAFYRNFAYHTQGDSIERINFKAMANVVDGLVLMILTK